MQEDEIETVIDDVYRKSLSSFGYDHVDVSFGTDTSGDAAIFATAHFEGGDEDGVPGGTYGPLLLAIVERLSANGETRFPYIRHAYAEPAVRLGR